MREYQIEIDREGRYVLRDRQSLIVIFRSAEPLSADDTLWIYRFAAASSLVAVERAKQLAESARAGVLPADDIGQMPYLWGNQE